MQHDKVMIPKADSNTVCRMYVMLPMTDDGRFYHVLNVLFIFRVFIVCIKFFDVFFLHLSFLRDTEQSTAKAFQR